MVDHAIKLARRRGRNDPIFKGRALGVPSSWVLQVHNTQGKQVSQETSRMSWSKMWQKPRCRGQVEIDIVIADDTTDGVLRRSAKPYCEALKSC
jgi:hypothetical protein